MVTATLLTVSLCLAGISSGAHVPRPDPIVVDGHWRFPGQRKADERELSTLLDAAGRFWDHRNVYGPAVQMSVADSLAADDVRGQRALARGGPGEILLDGKWAGARLAELRSRRPRARVRAVKSLYDVLIHEVGHSRGLEHTPGGIMASVAGTVAGDWASVARELGITRFPKPRPQRQRHMPPGRGEG